MGSFVYFMHTFIIANIYCDRKIKIHSSICKNVAMRHVQITANLYVVALSASSVLGVSKSENLE